VSRNKAELEYLGLAMHGKAKAELEYFDRMVRTERFVPDSITFVGVLGA
jgi:hypothetical protein